MYIIKTPAIGKELYFESYEIEEYSANLIILTTDINKARLFDTNDKEYIPFRITDFDTFFVDDKDVKYNDIYVHCKGIMHKVVAGTIDDDAEDLVLEALGWGFVKVKRETIIVEENNVYIKDYSKRSSSVLYK